MDLPGAKVLFDEAYGASTEESRRKSPFKNKDKSIIKPLRIDQEPILDKKTKLPEKDKKTGKVKTESWYVYPQVVPRGSFLAKWDRSAGGLWVKLWRDMIWTIMRGVPAQRIPFQKRARAQTSDDWRVAFNSVSNGDQETVELASTYYLGAQATTAEYVSFTDLARQQFLLHFWPFAAQVYVPRVLDKDGSSLFKNGAFVIAVPDVRELDTFCEELPYLLRERDNETRGYRPANAVVDLLEEGGLDTLSRIARRVSEKEGATSTADLVWAVDVFGMRKDGNNIRVDGSARIEPEAALVGRFERVQHAYWDVGFRRQRLLNVVKNRPWYEGFGRYLSVCSREVGIKSKTFRRDAREAFTSIEVQMADKKDEEPRSLEELVYRIVGTYLSGKLKSKHDLTWAEVKGKKGEGDYGQKREKLAREAFLGVRSRTGSDFVEYFSTVLFSVSQFLAEEQYLLVSTTLLQEPDKLRTLTLLALSARG